MNHTHVGKKHTLESVQQEFESWRSSRTNKREPIPSDLWKAATDLCREYSIARVSRQLGLSYTDLKKKIQNYNSLPQQFIEIETVGLAGQWQIECSRTDGSCFRMTGNGQPPAIETVLRSFLS